MTRYILAALFALSLPYEAGGQEGVILIDKFGGLNDISSPATLPPTACQDCLNVEANLSGTAILKRKGFTREAALIVATGPVTGSFQFVTDAGDSLVIVCHDRYCAKSANGAAFSNFLSTAGGSGNVPTRWSFVTVDGDLYGANDRRDAVFKYDGTTFTSPSEIPAGSLLALTEDRLVVGDTAANPNRLSYSKAGDYSEYTTGILAVDPWTDDLTPSDRSTGLSFCGGMLYRFTRNSTMVCLVDDQYTTQCSNISLSLGIADPNAVVCTPDGVYIRAQDKTYWRSAGGAFEPISRQIRNFTQNQISGSQRSNTQTTQSDWEAGTEVPSSTWDTTTTVGSIFPSSVTLMDTSAADWISGTLTALSTVPASGDLTLGISTFNFINGGFTSANFTNWTKVGTWNLASVTSIVSAELPCNTDATGTRWLAYGAGDADSTQTWRLSLLNSAGTEVKACTVAVTCVTWPADCALNSHTCDGAVTAGLAGDGVGVFSLDTSTFTFTSGKMRLTHNNGNSLTSIVSTRAAQIAIYIKSMEPVTGSWAPLILACGSTNYSLSGAITSRIFDTTYSTPTWGIFQATMTGVVSGETNIAFYTQTSTASDGGGFSAIATTSDTLRITSPASRYIRYRGDFTTSIATKTPSLQELSFPAATTGQFTTQCIQPGSNISSWGVLSCDETTVGAGSITLAVSTNTDCTSISTSAFTNVTNNATVALATAAATNIRFTSLLGSSTDQAVVNACTLYWTEGSVAQPAWGVYDPVGNAIYWTATTTSATQVDRVIKYDRNLDEWFPMDLRATALGFYNNALYFGSSTGGYWNKYGVSGVDSDNGSAINAYWKSKDFAGDPFRETAYKTVSSVFRNQGSGTATVTATLSNAASYAYSVSLSTISTISYIRSNYSLPLASPQTFFNLKFGNNAASQPFEVLGAKIGFFSTPWRVQSP